MSTLFMVATPIGNLGDITFRAIEILKNVDFIIAEDTRHAQILLKKYNITTPLLSFHAKSSETKAKELAEKIQKGNSSAYISDAGTPCLSDPGIKLVREARSKDVKLVPIPGASALTTLISIVGIPITPFIFHGFLPHKKGRQTILKHCKESENVNIFYESVHRFPRLLEELKHIIGPDRPIIVGRELTKMHEEVFQGTVSRAQGYFSSQNTKGEFIVLISSKKYDTIKGW